MDYIAGIAVNGAAYDTKPFANGTSNTGTQFADADQSYTPLNGLETPSSITSYAVQAGDTLQSIAAGLWGDASFWYLIASTR